MRIRKLLLIHPSRSIRALIEKYILAELSDIEFFEAENGAQGIELMSETDFNVILATDRIKDMPLAELRDRHEASVANGDTPMIIILESESKHDRNELVQQGFDRVVQIRERPSDLIRKINAACDPREWRKDARYHIPGAQVDFDLAREKLHGRLINISMGGVLVELTTDDPSALITGGISIALRIPLSSGGPAVITGLTAKMLRLEVAAWNEGLVPGAMRATFIFADLSAGARSRLKELIQMAREDKLDATVVRD